MHHYLAIALGGAVGAISRYWLGGLAERFNQSQFPVGTFTVNLLGSLCIGVLYCLLVEKAVISDQLRPLLVVGFLGAFTTFSTFSLELVLLMQGGRSGIAITYLLISVVLCTSACWAGIVMTRVLFNQI
jgi:CrcB protein